jgi:hypothetical protein
VPALVDGALFAAVQAQLDENRRRARIPEKGSRYLLQGLLVCCQCGYAYCGRTNDAHHAYERCAGAMNIPRQGFARVCGNKPLREETDGILCSNVVVEPLREQDRFVAVRAVDKTHKSTQLQKDKKFLVIVSRAIVYQNMVFSHSLSRGWASRR